MKWKKLGKIFTPTEHKLLNNCVEYAQSPQTLVFDDFIRVFFSSRERDKTGKYLSHISFVDFDRSLKNILGLSKEPVISLGELGCFDEHGIFPINILRDADKVLAYTTGWNRKVSVSADASIGLAISYNEGLTFERIGKGPILTASLNEPFLVGDAFVSKFNNEYHMWYIYGSRWIKNTTEVEPQRVYKIVYAHSLDGINWHREGRFLIQDKIDENECQALPSVIYLNNKYHMFFCYRHAFGFRNIKEKGYRIGYAYSTDLRNWTREDESVGIDISNDGWDSDMLCYPHVFHHDGNVYMLYNGNEFGRFGFGLAILEN